MIGISIFTLPTDFIQHMAVGVELANGDRFKAILLTPDQFDSKEIEDLIGERNAGNQLKHFQEKKADYAADANGNGYALPDGFVKAVSFYETNGPYEGAILNWNEFIDRQQSQFLAPTSEYPIAAIRDNRIYFAPDAGTEDYRLIYKQHPSRERPVCKIVDNKLYVKADFESGDKIYLTYLAHPILMRPVVRIVNNKVEVSPIDTANYTYKIGVYKYPVKQRPIVRVTTNGATGSTSIEVRPSSVTNLKAFYLNKPTEAVFGYTESNGVVTYASGSSTHLNWPPEAFNDIVTQALFYLGYSVDKKEIADISVNRDETTRSKTQQ